MRRLAVPTSVFISMIVAFLLCLVIARLPSLPGDVYVAQPIQKLAPSDPRWARVLTSTGRWPMSLLLSLLVVAISWMHLGRCVGALGIASFGVMMSLDWILHQLIFQPRPDSHLVRVDDPGLRGSAFPSTFAMTYFATFGYLAMVSLSRSRRRPRLLICAICLLLLTLGGLARIVLGAHWPSDVMVSYLIGFVVVAFLLRFLPSAVRG